jgi:cell shape-determining protein MreC
MALHGFRLNRKGAFALMMGASALCLLLPPAWTNPLKHVGQLLVPTQDLLYSASRKASRSIAGLDKAADAVREAEAMSIELASQAAALEQARSENERLKALRRDVLPLPTPVLPAKVVAQDIAASRDSVLAARGSVRGVRTGDWVSARLFVNQGSVSGVEEGQAVLAEHCLIGRIEQVSPYMARVQLFSDVDCPRIEVRIGAMEGRTFKFVEYPCSLRGMGHGTMLIEGVDYRHVRRIDDEAKDERRRIGLGDLVFSAPGQLGLPSPMVVGRVRELSEDAKKRLVYNVTVEPIVRMEEVRDVYVIPLARTAPVRE